MKSINKITIALLASLVATSATAASVDIRHEYKSHTEQHSTRVKMGDSIGNFTYSGELKFKGKNGEFLKDLQNNGWELDLGYRYKVNSNWTIHPGMPIEGRTSGMTYKPQLRATYALDSVEGLSLSARYRYDIKTYSDGSDTQNRHRITGNVNYSMDAWKFGFEANYYNADGYNIYNNTEENYELNVSIRRSFGRFSPYVEFGDVETGNDTATRELRSRVGLSYSF